ncbi:MAG: bifunctional (p)ppGpp synthetase/guanosine-3',5'-bis(diphosphate) 3'-pyrophosphohydrolase [Anaerolineae bacterium]|jgi:GTP pyrophosphokinase
MNLQTLLETIKASSGLDEDARELITAAYRLAEASHEGQRRASGEPYFQHSLAVASMLAELRLDPPTIAAGLLHDVVEDSLVNVEDLEDYFGQEVASLVDGVTKLGEIELSRMGQLTFHERESESLRKMFLAMFRDVRVVLIKLADRLHNMRTLGSLSEARRHRLARETLEIFAPLANRLGIWQWKWELENLGLRYLNPRRYREIGRLLTERRPARERDIQNYIDILRQRLAEEDIPNEHISGRPKHIYSIYRKMERKGLPFDQIHDMRGVRVIVDSVAQCYHVLGIVHGLWRPIPGEFDDYIATPKDNMYRSLHTAVVADDGKTLEVQIRTHEMHETAEYGIAAHWRYKEGRRRDIEFEDKISWLRQLMEWRHDITDGTEFIASLKTDVFQDRVYTFTPQGDVIDLPKGSTGIDFAYHIHTEIGHRCRGAKVNGKLVGLDYQLRNGDQVLILTTKRGGPSRDWLNPALGYTKTTRARSKIRQWFRRQKREENIAQGRELLERELKRLGVESMAHEKVFRLFQDERFEKLEDFLAAVGYGDINNQQIATRIIEAERKEKIKEEIELPALPSTTVVEGGVTVRGTGGLFTRLARCCSPIPGDEIVGYVTRGRGVTVHRRDCPNMLRVREQERLIEVDWGAEKKTYPVTIHITAYDRGGLMRDISAVVAAADINVTSFNVTTTRNIANLHATLEISEFSQLSSVLAQIERLPNVVKAQRRTG